MHSGAPMAFKTWLGHEYMVGIICPPLVGIGLRWLPKLGVDSVHWTRPHIHMPTGAPVIRLVPHLPIILKHVNNITLQS